MYEIYCFVIKIFLGDEFGHETYLDFKISSRASTLSYYLVCISSRMPVQGQIRSMMHGCPLGWPWLTLGLALAGPWLGPGWPWLALGLALADP